MPRKKTTTNIQNELHVDMNQITNPSSIMQTENKQSLTTKNFIIIDGSYYCFYRYYALTTWWKNANPDDTDHINFIDKPEFVEKFKSIFQIKIYEIAKKLKIKNPQIIVAKDCLSQSIWRHKLIDKYKANRVYDSVFKEKGCGAFFKIVFEENLFTNGGVSLILYHPQLEADDCAALYTKYLLEKDPENKVTIITSDHDYLQLLQPNLNIYNLQFKDLAEKSLKDPKKDLLNKILSGDKSDNICSVFNRTGPKTIMKLIENEDELNKKFDENPGSREKYELNKKVIDFNEIPQNLKDEFKDQYCN